MREIAREARPWHPSVTWAAQRRAVATKKAHAMRRFTILLLLLGLAVSTTGCVIEEPGRGGGGWCFWHPYRCR